MGAEEVLSFLTFLSVQRRVAASTQKVALNALACLYNNYLGRPLGNLGEFNRATQPRKLPVVLTRTEVRRLLGSLRDSPALLASLLYGSGLRRIEAIRLRVKDVDFDHLQLRIWAGKGNKHRITTLAPEPVPALERKVKMWPCCMNRNWPRRVMRGCGYPMLWPAKNRPPVADWGGTICFRPRA